MSYIADYYGKGDEKWVLIKESVRVSFVEKGDDDTGKKRQLKVVDIETDEILHFTTIDEKFLSGVEYAKSKDGGNTVRMRNIYMDSQHGLKFDKSNSSAFMKFKKELNKVFVTTYCKNGRKQYVGYSLNGIPYDEGKLYFDSEGNSIFYKGYFDENGKYDGKGTFYSPSGAILIKYDRLVNGNPIDNKDGRMLISGLEFRLNGISVNLEDMNVCNITAKKLLKDTKYADLLYDIQTTDEKVYQMKRKIKVLMKHQSVLSNKSQMTRIMLYIFMLFMTIAFVLNMILLR
jgi:hypothetical protein